MTTQQAQRIGATLRQVLGRLTQLREDVDKMSFDDAPHELREAIRRAEGETEEAGETFRRLNDPR